MAITALQGKYRASWRWQSGVAAWLVVVFADATRAARYENKFDVRVPVQVHSSSEFDASRAVLVLVHCVRHF